MAQGFREFGAWGVLFWELGVQGLEALGLGLKAIRGGQSPSYKIALAASCQRRKKKHGGNPYPQAPRKPTT